MRKGPRKGLAQDRGGKKETNLNPVQLAALTNEKRAQRGVCPRFHSQSVAEVGLVARKS